MSPTLSLKFLLNMTQHLELWCLSPDSYFWRRLTTLSRITFNDTKENSDYKHLFTHFYKFLKILKIILKMLLLNNKPVQLEDVHSSNLINKLSDLSSRTRQFMLFPNYTVHNMIEFSNLSNWIWSISYCFKMSFKLSKISNAHTREN